MSAKERLFNVLHFYFEDKYDILVDDRIILVDGDITFDKFGLSNEDYKAFSTFSQMSPEREKVNGDTKFYYYGGALILANAHNVKKDHKFVMRIQNGEDPSQYKEVDVRHKFISTRWGDFVYAFYPADGKLLGVYHKK